MKVLILHKWLVMGGIEKILISYLKLLQNESNLNIDLLIAFDTPDNVFAQEIPSNVNTHYLFDKNYYSHKQEVDKNRHNNIINRLKQKLHKFKEKHYCKKELNHLITQYDLIINFSDHFDQFINFTKFNNTPIIRWQHLALKDEYNKECRKEISYLKQYSKIIAICEEMRKDIQLKTKVSSEKLDCIYNPLNFSEVKQLSQQYNIDIESPYFIQVARLEKIKNHIALIEIYAELVKKGIPHKLYIIGNGSEYSNLERKIKELNLEERCILLGEIQNPYPYIRNAELFLHTSEREGLPTVLLESAILETVIVAMDCPTGPKEILNNGKCGELIVLGNNNEFIDKVYKLVNEPSLRDKYKLNMSNYINHFSEENIKQKFLYLLNEIKNKE